MVYNKKRLTNLAIWNFIFMPKICRQGNNQNNNAKYYA